MKRRVSIPVIRAKDEEEIDAAIKEHEERMKALAAVTEEIEATSEEETEVTDTVEESEELRTEEEKVEASKADAIANELKDVPKIIKKKEKKEVSAPEEISNSGNNPFKTDEIGFEDMVESSTEN